MPYRSLPDSALRSNVTRGRVQVRAVRRQEEHPVSLRFQQGLCLRRFVGGEIVGDHHVAGLEHGGELGLDIGIEGRAVHGSVKEPGRAQIIDTQLGDKSLRAPVAEGGTRFQTRAARGLPRSRVILVVTAVSSMNTSRCGSSRILG